MAGFVPWPRVREPASPPFSLVDSYLLALGPEGKLEGLEA